MNELKAVANIVANSSGSLIPALIADDAIPSVNSRTEAIYALDSVVRQSQPGTSRRVWATVFAVLTAVLAVPEVQALLGPWAPVATAVLSASLAAWSKASDPRPTR